jgi:hypothetical protein
VCTQTTKEDTVMTQLDDEWPEPDCTCTQVDVDYFDASTCEYHHPFSDWNVRQRILRAEADAMDRTGCEPSVDVRGNATGGTRSAMKRELPATEDIGRSHDGAVRCRTLQTPSTKTPRGELNNDVCQWSK